MYKFGVLGCSEIAFRRFMPAIQEVNDASVVAVAEEYDERKLDAFCTTYGIASECSFEAVIKNPEINAITIPQPPALHYKWAKLALENGKHVLLEKPSTTSYKCSKYLTELAEKRDLSLHDNYMF